MNRKLEMLLEVFFVSLIILDIFLLFISIVVPIRPSSFHNIALFDLFTSISLVFGYLIRMRHKDPLMYLKTNWNGVIAVIPFYFIGLNVLGLFEALILFKILNILKIITLIMAIRQVGKSVDQFVEKSRLVYGFSFFAVVCYFVL